jgi:hypothetical protein
MVSRANDAVVEARQALAVRHAEAAAQDWAGSTPEQQAATANAFRDAALHPGADVDYCGMFVSAQYRSAGLHAEFRMIFNHTDNVRAFFTYNREHPTTRVFGTIVPLGSTAPMPVEDYHRARGSLRRILTTDEVIAAQNAGTFARCIRPGDVVTLAWNAQAQHADHVAMVRSVTDTGFTTFEGNAEVELADGTVAWGVGTNRWSSDVANATDTRDTFDNQRAGAGRGRARVFLVGRPSIVDFEAGHAYQ